MLGEAGIGYFYLRLLYPEIETCLLPGSEGAWPRIAADVDDSYQQALDRNVRRHFGRTLAVLERRGRPTESSIEVANGSAEALDDVHMRLQNVVESLNATDAQGRLMDAWLPECIAFQLLSIGRTPGQRAVDDLCNIEMAAIDWGQVEIRLTPLTQIHEATWDWETWLLGPNDESEPRRLSHGHAYVITDRANGRPWTRVGPFVAAVLRAVVIPRTVDEVVAHLREAIGEQVPSERLVAVVTQAIQEAQRAGVTSVRAPSTSTTLASSALAVASG
jgi:hypothetical protein